MSGEIDLESGDPAYAEESPAAQRRARRKANEGTKPKASSSPRSSSKANAETEVRSRLERAFERIAEWREARGDEELAEIIREDKEAMAQGGVAAIHALPVLGPPLIMFLNLLEPVLAFGRVGRVLAYRFAMRRAARHGEQDQAQQEWEQAQTVPVVEWGQGAN